MKIAAKLLRAFAYGWGFLLMLSVMVGLIGIWWKEGFGAVREVFSPFNLWNWGLIILLSLPAVGANVLADKLTKRPSSP